MQVAERILATLLVLIHQFRRAFSQTCDSYMILELSEGKTDVITNIEHFNDEIRVEFSNGHKIGFVFPTSVVDWLLEMKHEWSYLIGHLELGRSLNDFLLSLFLQF